MAKKMPERDVRIEMHIVIEMVDGKRNSMFFCRNLSEGGMFLECIDPPKKGSLLTLEFRLPHNKTKLRVSGRAMWSSRDYQASKSQGIGVRFEGLTDGDKKNLNDALAYFKNLKRTLVS